MKIPSLNSLVRNAYKNRYCFSKVTINKGKIIGIYENRQKVFIGLLADHFVKIAGKTKNISLLHKGEIVFKFAANTKF